MKNTTEKITLENNQFRAVLIDKHVTGTDGIYHLQRAGLGWLTIGKIDAEQRMVLFANNAEYVPVPHLKSIIELANMVHEAWGSEGKQR
jgi:hypothetical protein